MTKVFRYILILVLLQLAVEGNAQYKKPLSSPRKQLDNAMFNIGVIAGPNYTHWHHFDVAQADDWYLKDYVPEFKLGYTGGFYFEAILNKHLSAGLNAMYARHRVSMHYINEQFPYDWHDGQLLYLQRRYELKADYHAIEASLPVTFYFMNPKDIVRPYIYAAPRFSYIIGGDNIYTTIDSIPNKKPKTGNSQSKWLVLLKTYSTAIRNLKVGTKKWSVITRLSVASKVKDNGQTSIQTVTSPKVFLTPHSTGMARENHTF